MPSSVTHRLTAATRARTSAFVARGARSPSALRPVPPKVQLRAGTSAISSGGVTRNSSSFGVCVGSGGPRTVEWERGATRPAASDRGPGHESRRLFPLCAGPRGSLTSPGLRPLALPKGSRLGRSGLRGPVQAGEWGESAGSAPPTGSPEKARRPRSRTVQPLLRRPELHRPVLSGDGRWATGATR